MVALLAALHIGVSAGAGAAHDVVGLRLEARVEHFSVSAAVGPFSYAGPLTNPDNRSAAFAARWYSGDRGDRLFASVQYVFVTAKEWSFDAVDGGHLVPWHISVATVTAGWRARSDQGFCIDLGAGGGAYFTSKNGYRPRAIPDVTVALGWEF